MPLMQRYAAAAALRRRCSQAPPVLQRPAADAAKRHRCTVAPPPSDDPHTLRRTRSPALRAQLASSGVLRCDGTMLQTDISKMPKGTLASTLVHRWDTHHP